MSTALLTRQSRPSKDAVRSVFIHIQFGKFDPKKIPTDLDSTEWREWIHCTPKDIENGTLAGLACNRAFRNAGGTGLFHQQRKVEVHAVIFDPAVHLLKDHRISDCHRTTYHFTPTA